MERASWRGDIRIGGLQRRQRGQRRRQCRPAPNGLTYGYADRGAHGHADAHAVTDRNALAHTDTDCLADRSSHVHADDRARVFMR